MGKVRAYIRSRPEGEDQITDDEEGLEETEILSKEDVVIDYTHWIDFGHTWARTWQEVRAVWRCVPMSRKEIIKRFGKEIGSQIPMDATKNDTTPDDYKRAGIYEIWDKETKKVFGSAKITRMLLMKRMTP